MTTGRLVCFLIFLVLASAEQSKSVRGLVDLLLKILWDFTSTDWSKKLDELLKKAADHNVTEECIDDLHYIRNLILDTDELKGKSRLNESMALLQMLDSSGKIPTGIMRGNLIWSGLPNECFGISKFVKNRQRAFKGAYCRANLEIPGHDCAIDVRHELFDTRMIGWDICIPNSCKEDVKRLLNQCI